jgi:hypothetical protein
LLIHGKLLSCIKCFVPVLAGAGDAKDRAKDEAANPLQPGATASLREAMEKMSIDFPRCSPWSKRLTS